MKNNRIVTAFGCVVISVTGLWSAKSFVEEPVLPQKGNAPTSVSRPTAQLEEYTAYNVSVTCDPDAGEVTLTPAGNSITPGTTLEITAKSKLGYYFEKLNVKCIGTSDYFKSWMDFTSSHLVYTVPPLSSDGWMPEIQITATFRRADTLITGANFTALGTEKFVFTSLGSTYFYDVNQDGVLEYVREEKPNTNSNSPSYYYVYPNFYRGDGEWVWTMKEGAKRTLFAMDDLNRDGVLELVQKNKGSDRNPYWLYFTSYTAGVTVDSLLLPGSLEFSCALDANVDGRTDYFYYDLQDNYKIVYQRPDGSFYVRNMEIITDEKEIESLLFSQNGANPVVQNLHLGGSSLAKAPLLRPKKSAPQKVSEVFDNGYGHPLAIDINMDGLPDLLNLYNGNALFSLGKGRYYYGSFEGQVTAKDLNGDGVPDYIVYNQKAKTVYLYIYQGQNKFSEQLLMENANITGIYCTDFDRDGDVDILLPFDYTTSSQYAFLVFFQNQGNGSFRKKERSFTETYSFPACADVDNDGLQEVVAARYVRDAAKNEMRTEYTLIKCTKNFSVEADASPFLKVVDRRYEFSQSDSGPSKARVTVLDEDHDGLLEFRTCRGDFGDDRGQSYGRFDFGKKNTCPQKMAAPTYALDGSSGMVRVQWTAGTDAETSACDLSYALRVGTAPGKGDVWYAHALADGTRLRPGNGNAANNLYQLLDASTWDEGTYYLSVQAIDANGLGGAWSDATPFTLNAPFADFQVSHTSFTLGDTLDIYLNAPYRTDYSYQLSLGADAQVTDLKQGHWQVRFKQDGPRTISLQVTDAQGKMATCSQNLTIYPLRWIEIMLGWGLRADWDMNGTLDLVGSCYDGELYSSNKLEGVFSNNGKGTFTKVGRTYNSDFRNIGPYVAIDYNMDGLPDFIRGYKEKNLFLNEESFDFSYSTVTWPKTPVDICSDYGFFKYKNWADFNGDGYWDFVYNGSDSKYNCYLYLNKGNNLDFEKVLAGADTNNRVVALADFNGDGRMDYVTVDATSNILYLYLNEGNGNFSDRLSIATSTPYQNVLFADFNNDGWLDLLLRSSDNSSRIYPGNASLTYEAYLSFPYGLARYDYGNVMQNDLLDFDNNGYLDLIVRPQNDSYESVGVLYMYPNWETRFCPGDEMVGGFPSDLCYRDYTPFVDINGDGCPDYNDFLMSTTLTNESPQTPEGVCAVQHAKGVTLKWNAAVDKETPVTQMRYNVSLKKAGVSGDNSYLISPMNGESDVAAVVPGYPYQHATELTLPLNQFVAGQKYELRVQSIDLWNAHSKFSDVYTFTVSDQVSVEAPVSTGTGVQTTLSYVGTTPGIPTWDLQDGTLVSTQGNQVVAVWNTSGTKTITVMVGGVNTTRAISVAPSPDLSFTLPAKILANSQVEFTLPAAFATHVVSVRSSLDPKPVEISSSSELLKQLASVSSEEPIVLSRRGKTLDGRLTVNAPDGTYWLEFVCEDPLCGEVTFRRTFQVIGQNIIPQISLVTVDDATGKNKITWAQPKDLPTSDITFDKVVIYRETSMTNHFELLDEALLSAGMYVDRTSDPMLRKYRYRIALKSTEGAVSTPSAVHSSVHVMLNRGLQANSVNMIWTPYEGALLEQYTILRGTSPDNMQVLTTVSGYETSYTDFQVPTGDMYYALQYTGTYSDEWSVLKAPQRRSLTQTTHSLNGRSNVVNVNQSMQLTLASSLKVLSLETERVLTPSSDLLHFYAEVLPAMATYKQVNWSIVSGANLATISSNGILRYSGNGTNGVITLKAATVDGSGLSETVSVTTSGFVSATDEIVATPAYKVFGQPGYLVLTNAENCQVAIYSLSGSLVRLIRPMLEREQVSLPSGIYFVRIGADTYKVFVQ